MKINSINEKEVFNNLDGTSHKFNISKQGQQFIIDALSNTIYKNPIGTIIREYVSNAHDANVEAGTTQPVVVSLNKDGNGHYLSVVDMGVGLSEQRITTVFVNYGESTKRNNDNEIGGFGIGAKSAFSYSDTFFVNTVVEGSVYKYILMKTNHEPEMQLISKEPNDEGLPVGTEIRIYLKDGDVLKFKNEIYNQLRYFDEVFVTDEPAFNEYKIKEFDTFKFSTQAIQNDKFKRLHLTLGKVAYPIDFNLLGIQPIEIPLALKFNIGELKVTLSREELQYDETTKTAIRTKIALFKEELKTLYLAQKSSFVNFGEFKKQSEVNPSIFIDDNNSFKIGNVVSGVKRPFTLKQLPFLNSNNFPDNPYFFLKCERKINGNSNFVQFDKYNGNPTIQENLLKQGVYLPKGCEKDKLTSLYLQSIKRDYVVEDKDLNYKIYYRELSLRPTHKTMTENMNNTKRIKLYKAVISQEVFKHLVRYDEVVIPKEFKDQADLGKRTKLEEQKRLRALNKVELKGVEVYDVARRAGKGYSKNTVDFATFKGTIVLGKKENCESMANLKAKYSRLNSRYHFICLTNNKTYDELLKRKCVVSIDNFQKVFKVEKALKQKVVRYHINYNYDLENINLKLFPKLIKELENMGNTNCSMYDVVSRILNIEILIPETVRFELNKVKRFNKLFPYSKQIFGNTFYNVNQKQIFDLSKKEEEELLKFRKLLTKHGLYPGKNAYVPICNWEYEFIKQNETKLNYLQSLNK